MVEISRTVLFVLSTICLSVGLALIILGVRPHT